MIKLSMPNISDEECKAVERVLRSGQLVHGEECSLFEKELAQYLGCNEVVVVSSGTAALHLALVALGIGPGDAVLVPDFTFPATVNVVELVGARPILVDVDSFTYNITSGTVQQAINEWNGIEKIRAIMPVHEFGCPADMAGIMKIAEENELVVIEDAACGLGAINNKSKVGTIGHIGCFSFHPRKAITTGEGGALATNDLDVAEKLRTWRNHGIHYNNGKMKFVLPGFNYRMTNFQAALGRVQLHKFEEWLVQRKNLQASYREQFHKMKSILLPVEVQGHAWQTFMICLSEGTNRDAVIDKLKKYDIETNLGAQSIHCLDFYKNKYPQMAQRHNGNIAERLYKYGLALPFHQNLSQNDVVFVSDTLKKILGEKG